MTFWPGTKIPRSTNNCLSWQGAPSVFSRDIQRQADQREHSSRRVDEARAEGKTLSTIRGISRRSDKRLEEMS